jgi:NAD(P)H-dependent FMN reductase
LQQKEIEAHVFSLKNLDVLNKNPAFLKAEAEYLFPAQKFIFIIPEYNGSFPGVLKASIDTSDIKKCWWYKKALLTGVSTGRAGNLRGMDHISDVLNHMKMTVHYNKLPISVIDQVMDEDGIINNRTTLQVINQQLEQFIKF